MFNEPLTNVNTMQNSPIIGISEKFVEPLTGEQVSVFVDDPFLADDQQNIFAETEKVGNPVAVEAALEQIIIENEINEVMELTSDDEVDLIESSATEAERLSIDAKIEESEEKLNQLMNDIEIEDLKDGDKKVIMDKIEDLSLKIKIARIFQESMKRIKTHKKRMELSYLTA